MSLEVVDHRPHAWFLLRDGQDHYLDVNCDIGAVGFSLLVRFSELEAEEYRALGRVFTDYLAAKIACWPDRFRDRDASRERSAEVSAAVAKYRSTQPAA